MASSKPRKRKRKRSTPSIYVASLADYNAGRLHGEWIDATQDLEQIREEIAEMLAKSRSPHAEEWAIHDTDFYGVDIDEHESLESVHEAAKLIEEHGALAAEIINYFGGVDNLDDAVATLTDKQAGSADTLEDWASDYLEETGLLAEVPEALRNYIDFKSYGRDLELSGSIFSVRVDGTLHVFWTY